MESAAADIDAAIAALDRLLPVDVDGLDVSDLEAVVRRLGPLQAKLDALKYRAVRAWDRSGRWRFGGARTCGAWLAAEWRADPRTGGRAVREARHMATLPRTSAALAAGEISADHVARIVGLDNERTSTMLRACEREIVEFAKRRRWCDFKPFLDEWRQLADPDGVAPTRERRQVTLLDSDDGSLLSGWLDQISAEAVRTELERLEKELYRSDVARARDALGRDPIDGELERTRGQRMADALVEMAKRSASTPEDAQKPKPLVTIFVGVDSLRRMCRLRGGGVLHPDLAAEVLDDAMIESIVFDTKSRDITASGRRTYTGALRRAIEAVHGSCYHPYCNQPAHRCQVDHVQPWSEGGQTTFDNGQLACGYHNRWRTNSYPPEPKPAKRQTPNRPPGRAGPRRRTRDKRPDP